MASSSQSVAPAINCFSLASRRQRYLPVAQPFRFVTVSSSRWLMANDLTSLLSPTWKVGGT